MFLYEHLSLHPPAVQECAIHPGVEKPGCYVPWAISGGLCSLPPAWAPLAETVRSALAPPRCFQGTVPLLWGNPLHVLCAHGGP